MTDNSNNTNKYTFLNDNYNYSINYNNEINQKEDGNILTDKNGKRWKEIISTVGTYYMCEETGNIQYDRPEIVEPVDTFLPADYVSYQQPQYLEYTEHPIDNSFWVERLFTNGTKCYFHTQTYEMTWEKPIIENENKGKAVDAQPIPESDWMLVKSDKNDIFYFNSKKQLSVWNKPEELNLNKHFQKLYDQFSRASNSNNDNTIEVGKRSFNTLEELSDIPENHDKTVYSSYKKCKISDSEESTSSTADSDTDDNIQSITEIKTNNNNNNLKYDTLADSTVEMSDLTKQMLLLPYEERVMLFKEMLDEYNVSAFGTWENECTRLKNDPRFEILSLKERKIHYNEFLRNRVSTEATHTRKEREEKKIKFFEFLKKVIKDPRMKYLEFSSKYSSAPEFNLFVRTKEREMFFNEYMDTYVRSTICVDPKQIKSNYWKMLDELQIDIDNCSWKSVKSSLKNDLRFINVDGSKQRKSWFKQYIKELKAKKKFENKSKEEIALLSIRQRENEVLKEKSQLVKSRQKTLDHFEYKNSIEQLNVLLNHYIQTCLFSYETIMKIFQEKASTKIESIKKHLKSGTIHKIVSDHINKIESKQIQLLHYTLDELIDVGTINLNMKLSDVCNVIHKARNITIDIPDEKLKCEFEKYILQKEDKYVEQFRTLLKETKLLDLIFQRKSIYSTTNDDIVNEVTDFIKRDRRYQQLAYNPSKQNQLILEQIESKRAEIGLKNDFDDLNNDSD